MSSGSPDYHVTWRRYPRRFIRQARRPVDRLREGMERVVRIGGRPSWPHRVLYIAGLPKSGTHWLASLLGSVPGYRLRKPYDPDRCTYRHDVCREVFVRLPSDLYSVVRHHTQCNEGNLAVLKSRGIVPIVMTRDLRDQCVARYFHVLQDRGHRHHSRYTHATREDGLRHCVEFTLKRYVPWVRQWRKEVRLRSEAYVLTSFERMHASPAGELGRILTALDIHGVDVEDIVEDTRAGTTFNLRRNLLWRKGTARKGIVGDWRNHLRPDLALLFEDACPDLLYTPGVVSEPGARGEKDAAAL